MRYDVYVCVRLRGIWVRAWISSSRAAVPLLTSDVRCRAATCDPTRAEQALVKAVLLTLGAVEQGARPLRSQLAESGGGLEIDTWCDLPPGSGLGTSSILAATLVSAVGAVLQLHLEHDALACAVVRVEQVCAAILRMSSSHVLPSH